jgi:translation initiation factor IF-1
MANNPAQVLVLEGEVLENLPNTQFKVRIKDSTTEIICYLSGKMRKNYIKILPGDRVKFEITPYDPRLGRIIFRIAG